ncbi:MAG TPA: hypothetical protein VLW50_17335, partial [Streptosporangiaceae bacterium]|nr:hypothetical protein [Streptosporangiaceae bacterium]
AYSHFYASTSIPIRGFILARSAAPDLSGLETRLVIRVSRFKHAVVDSKSINYAQIYPPHHLHIALGESRCSALSEPACRWRVSRFSAAG